jgi:heptosyltransferase-2
VTLERIVVVAPNWLGDAVMALPALAAVRARWPEAALVAAGRASTVPLFSMVPGVDEVVRLDSRGGVVGAVSWAEDAAALRGARANLAILLPNSFRSAWTAQRAGIAERWGYGADLRGRLLTRTVTRLRPPYHMADYYLHLVRELVEQGSPEGLPHENAQQPQGASVEGVSVEQGSSPARLPRLLIPSGAQERASELLARLGLGPGCLLVGLAPGAAYGKAKQWSPERFAALAVGLHQRLGATSLLFGARADATTTGVISRAARGAADRNVGRTTLPTAQAEQKRGGRAPAVIDLAGQTDLPLLAALMARCHSVVSNDSGAMHVAAAVGVPVTAVFGATNEHHTAPLPCDAPGIAAHEILTSPVWCRPCMLRECPIDHRCMRRVDPAAVAAAVERQIKKTEDRRRKTE